MTRALSWLSLSCLLGTPLSGQAQDSPTRVTGIVVDASTGKELPGALVRLLGEPQAAATDGFGVFRLERVPSGPHVVSIAQYGYETATLPVTLPLPDNGWLDVALDVAPFALEGITVVVDRLQLLETRLRGRRNAATTAVEVFDQKRMVTTGAWSMGDFFKVETTVTPISCVDDDPSGCVLRRGRIIPTTICIDDVPAMGGWDQLATYRPQDFYLLEVYGGGAQIRAYTHTFVDLMIRHPQALVTSELAC